VTSRRENVPPPLHELESQVMAEVWSRGHATVRDVLESLNHGRRKRAYTTIMTIMRRLHRKGMLRRVREGRTDVYSPVLSRSAYAHARAAAEADALVERYGDVALSHFARALDELGGERVAEIRSLAEQLPGSRR
jgi:predicted transcriptional regulator